MDWQPAEGGCQSHLGKGVIPHCIPQKQGRRAEQEQMDGAESSVKKRSEKRQKQERLTVRFTPAEREQLEALAERAGLTLASYLRSRALEKPTTRARRRPTVEVKALTKLLSDLNRVGNNLNQQTKLLRIGIDPTAEAAREAYAIYLALAAQIKGALDGNT